MGTTIHIPTNSTFNTTVSDNFRGITLCFICGRIIDLFILNRYSDQLLSNELQFGFKGGKSTSNLY
jgi:hypothetical protein